MKGKIHQDDLNSEHLGPNARAFTFLKETLLKLKSHVEPHPLRGRLQHPTLTNGQVIETETKQRNNKTNTCYQMDLTYL